MPKYYCEYCDIYLTHSSAGGRRQHNSGRKHINNKIEYYTALIREKMLAPPIYPVPAHLQDAIRPNMMAGRAPMPGVLPPLAPPPAFNPGVIPGAVGGLGKLGLPPGMLPGKGGLATHKDGPATRPPVIRAPNGASNDLGQLPPQPKVSSYSDKRDSKGYDAFRTADRGSFRDDDSRDGDKGRSFKDFKGGRDYDSRKGKGRDDDFKGKGSRDFDRDRGSKGPYDKGGKSDRRDFKGKKGDKGDREAKGKGRW